ncbi:MAG: flagellar hook-length control protein FliK [Solirubrobacteraceae bacterium]
MIERVAVDALLLRTQLPELSLREGSSVVARVAARAEAHGVLVLAGVPLTAQLPPEVQAGQTLHLRVEEVTPERVTLRLDPQAAGVAPPPPGGWDGLNPRPPRVAVGEPPRRGGDGDPESATVTLAFDSEILGRLDLRVDLASGTVTAGITAPPGMALELAQEAAGRLQAALAEKTNRAAQVRVAARRDPFDAYA